MGAPSKEVVYSLAITITLCTSAPLCPPRHPAPFVVPPISLLVWTLDYYLFLSLLVFSHRFFAMSFFLPSFVPRSSCRIDHDYSAIVFNLPCSCCGCRRISRAFRYHVLYWSFSSFFFLFLPLVCFLYCSSLSSPRCLVPKGSELSISQAIASSSRLSCLFPPFALPFILEMGIGIHETKLMITTSKQHRTTNGYLSSHL